MLKTNPLDLGPDQPSTTMRSLAGSVVRLLVWLMLTPRLISFCIADSIVPPALSDFLDEDPYLSNPLPCNGRPEYCNQRYSNLTFLGSHNAPFAGPLPQHNQAISVTRQLQLGVRFMQAQVHAPGSERSRLLLCHTSCALENAGSVAKYLRKVVRFLDQNPREVITLLFVNADGVSVDRWSQVFQSEKAAAYAYAPAKHPVPLDEWPTLKQLIDRNKRLIVFLDTGADVTRVPYLLDEFAHFWETPFGVTNPAFPDCELDRPPVPRRITPLGRSKKEKHAMHLDPVIEAARSRMYLINHFLDTEVTIFGNYFTVPQRGDAYTTNIESGVSGIVTETLTCLNRWGRLPNVVLLNWIDIGPVLRIEGNLNDERLGIRNITHRGQLGPIDRVKAAVRPEPKSLLAVLRDSLFFRNSRRSRQVHDRHIQTLDELVGSDLDLLWHEK